MHCHFQDCGNDSVFYSGFPPQQPPGFDAQAEALQGAYNPFDDMDPQAQLLHQNEFQEFQDGSHLQDFLAEEEKECLANNQFLEDEVVADEPLNASVWSGISDRSIVLRNNGLWTGNTSGVNLDKLREETKLSRCEYFRHNSSR